MKKFAAAAITLALATTSVHAVTFKDFADTTTLNLLGTAQSATTNDGAVLRLTSAQSNQSGSAFSQQPLNAKSFSTYFRFRMTEPGGIADCNGNRGADGLTFVIQKASADKGGIGGGIGYGGITDSVAVEFDTWCNSIIGETLSNHIAINTNGKINHDASNPAIAISPEFSNGQIWSAWVDYNGKTLEVRVSPDNTKPTQPQLQQTIDIPALLGNTSTAYLGFAAGTGGAWENHDILYWEYREKYQPVTSLSGSIFGLQDATITCKNLSTKQTLTLPASAATGWNCSDAGLTGKRGQKTVITISGKLN